MPQPPLRRADPFLKGHDATQTCSGYIYPLDAFCTCGATYRTSDGTGVVISDFAAVRYDAGGNSLSVHPLPPRPRRTTTMRSRSRDRLLTLAVTVIVIIVLALFVLPWVYIATTASGDIGATVIWTAGVEVTIVGIAAIVGIILIVSDS